MTVARARPEVVLDVTRLVDRLGRRRQATGIDRVGLAYVAHFLPVARVLVRWAGFAHVLPAAESRRVMQWLLAPRGLLWLYAWLACGMARAPFVSPPRAPWVMHTGHGGLEDPLLHGLLARLRARLLVLIHDLIPLTHPQFCRAGEDQRHAARMHAALRFAHAIVCISGATRAELARWATGRGCDLPPTLVAPLAPALAARVAAPRPLAAPYFVVLGTIEPRKNHQLLVAVWAMLRARLGTDCPQLVVIGQSGWDCAHTIAALRAGEARGDFLLLMDGLDDASATTWLQHAAALLFPSFTEGFGLPLVEALALGVPVIASDLPVFHEIAGERPVYLDPQDVSGWADAIQRQLAARGDGCAPIPVFTPTTWPAHCAAVAGWLETLPITQPHAAPVYALGFSRWKRRAVETAFAGRNVNFVSQPGAVPPGACLAVWGAQPATRPDVDVIRLEDGFLRSVGLGAELIRPLSWVLDGRGIYFDAGQPSDLEVMLETQAFAPAELDRAAAYRQRLVASGLTKYNLGGTAWRRPPGAERVVLVVGQVESDASLSHGAAAVRTNLALAQAARAAAPAAYLVYKPHPDVVRGLRAAGDNEVGVADVVDEVLPDTDLPTLLGAVDEVHVITSLAGFEALLRGVPVTCHGLPFYAGWGLTTDRCRAPRRSRRLTLDELVAAALLRYPVYFSRDNRRVLTPEQALDALLVWRESLAGRGEAWWRPLWRRLLRRVVGVR